MSTNENIMLEFYSLGKKIVVLLYRGHLALVLAMKST